jgi:PucR family transcriptional regulator, purine catabolism regulatory protein
MKLAEALSIQPLNAGCVVAGADYVDKDISWVQIVDHPDIESWVKQGHLLLSTGYTWPKDDEAASSVVEKLAAKGICGVVLAVPQFLDHFPSSSVQAAERVGLPLMEIPWEVPFSEITLAVHRELVDQHGKALVRSEQIHRELTEAAVSGSSLSDVARVLASVLGRRIDILSVDGLVLGTHTPEPVGVLAKDVGIGEAFRALDSSGEIQRARVSPRPVRFASGISDTHERSPSVGYAVRVRADCVGYVLVTEGATPLTPLEMRAIEHAGTVAALQISHRRELSMQEARLGDALVAALLEGRFEEKPQSSERAKLLGWDRESRYRLCSILLDEPNPLSRGGFEKRERVAASASQSLQRRNVRPIMSLAANQIQVLVPETLDVDAWWSDFPVSVSRLAMAVSQINSGVDGMRKAGIEVAELIEHLKPGRVHHFEELLFPRVLRGDLEAQRKFIDRLFGSLGQGKRTRALLDTALALGDAGFHLQRTAEVLGIHISTLRYRLNRLSDLTGLDLETVEGRFRLQVGARLFRMNET